MVKSLFSTQMNVYGDQKLLFSNYWVAKTYCSFITIQVFKQENKKIVLNPSVYLGNL